MIAAGAWVCLLAPLAAVLAIALGGNRLPRRAAGYLATGADGRLLHRRRRRASPPRSATAPRKRATVTTAFGWLETHAYSFKLALLVDPLSLVMMLVVAGVGMLIVAYSIGYMDGDDEERRFFAYMAFFVFSMLLLVEAAELLHPACRLGPGRALLLPADRLLAPSARARSRRPRRPSS